MADTSNPLPKSEAQTTPNKLPIFVSPFTEPRFWNDPKDYIVIHHAASGTTLHLDRHVMVSHCTTFLDLEIVCTFLAQSDLPIQAIVDWCHAVHYILVPKPIFASGACFWTRQVMFLIHLCWVNEALGISCFGLMLRLVSVIQEQEAVYGGRPQYGAALIHLLKYLNVHHDKFSLTPLDVAIYACVGALRTVKRQAMPIKLKIALQHQQTNINMRGEGEVDEFTRAVSILEPMHPKLHEALLKGIYQFDTNPVAMSFIVSYLESSQSNPVLPVFDNFLNMETQLTTRFIAPMHLHDPLLPSFRETFAQMKSDADIPDSIQVSPKVQTYKIVSGDEMTFDVLPWVMYHIWPLYDKFHDGGFPKIAGQSGLEITSLPAVSVLAIIAICYGSIPLLETAMDDMTHRQREHLLKMKEQLRLPFDETDHVSAHAGSYLQKLITNTL